MNLYIEDIKRFEPQAVNKQALTKQELEQIAFVLTQQPNRQYEILFHLLMSNGMWIGEVFSIDGNNIQDEYVYIKNEKQKGGSRSQRLAYLNPYIKQLISKHKFKLKQNKVRAAFVAIEKLMKLHYPSFNKPLSPHILRYTFATVMYENNIPLPTISKLMGHANAELTMNTYVRDNPTIQIKIF